MPKPCVGCAQPKTNSPPNPAPRKKTSGPKKSSPAAQNAYKFPEPDLRQNKNKLSLQEQLEYMELEQQYQQKLKDAAKRWAERHGIKRPMSYFEMRKNMEEFYAQRDKQLAATGGKRKKTRPAKR